MDLLLEEEVPDEALLEWQTNDAEVT